MQHISVLKEDVQKYLDLKSGEVLVDTTLGLGGHSKDALEKIGEKGRLIAFEQDERNLEEAQRRLKAYEKQTVYIHDNFRHLKTRITGSGFDQVDAILFDLGLSSPHVDEEDRGFSFSKDGPLDMRFDPRAKLTAAEVINEYREEDLMKIFFEYGEEKMSRKIAGRIVERRADKLFSSTAELAEYIESVVPRKRSKKGSSSHPATRIFQALRIEVNDELGALSDALEQIINILRVGGRVVAISYHSLEDRMVKKFFKKLERPVATGENAIYSNFDDPIFESITKKPVIPSEKEIEENPRSRSAKLRAYIKVREP
ncbi:16S rRNA (cytosine(1402)-N(4))-methyltransferase RsmH [Candidatus Peregrinibacteria bacterium]|jgi:16S rRNA (cytosine1402-N4)-methyltransferase|nr:16S rRNA (cytosine(1402)-N(4))-methyltransferase RsmH [Candidatus Peregrinibacteria bacterium]MBT7736154.1 16S rRNA (cytosine(1402)-N(4))-methyltransferase RsmH [Candidatus Peregrinibacteria bacterium]